MSNQLVTTIKNLLSPQLRGIVRPIYYRLVNLTNSLKQPPITRLHRAVFTAPELQFRLKFFQAAQIYLRVNRINGSYLEFGSHEANTFRIALNTLGMHGQPNHISHFWAFDSFEGMPEPTGIDKQKIWRVSMNTTSEESFKKITRKDAYRVTTVKGFYDKSLPTVSLSKDQYPALAYLDCDYYTSTRDVLNWLTKYLRHGCLLAFDDWDCYFADNDRGQRKAFLEFSSKMVEQFEFVEFMKFDSGGMAFVCLEKSKIGTDFSGY